jgi:hypothetical protein
MDICNVGECYAQRFPVPNFGESVASVTNSTFAHLGFVGGRLRAVQREEI